MAACGRVNLIGVHNQAVCADHSKLQETDPEVTPGKGVMSVGAVLVHRFYMRRSLNDFSPKVRRTEYSVDDRPLLRQSSSWPLKLKSRLYVSGISSMRR